MVGEESDRAGNTEGAEVEVGFVAPHSRLLEDLHNAPCDSLLLSVVSAGLGEQGDTRVVAYLNGVCAGCTGAQPSAGGGELVVGIPRGQRVTHCELELQVVVLNKHTDAHAPQAKPQAPQKGAPQTPNNAEPSVVVLGSCTISGQELGAMLEGETPTKTGAVGGSVGGSVGVGVGGKSGKGKPPPVTLNRKGAVCYFKMGASARETLRLNVAAGTGAGVGAGVVAESGWARGKKADKSKKPDEVGVRRVAQGELGISLSRGRAAPIASVPGVKEIGIEEPERVVEPATISVTLEDVQGVHLGGVGMGVGGGGGVSSEDRGGVEGVGALLADVRFNGVHVARFMARVTQGAGAGGGGGPTWCTADHLPPHLLLTPPPHLPLHDCHLSVLLWASSSATQEDISFGMSGLGLGFQFVGGAVVYGQALERLSGMFEESGDYGDSKSGINTEAVAVGAEAGGEETTAGCSFVPRCLHRLWG
ncbi:hypothetical protein B484DRAFT_399750 [Ochromonadaceae sp. CCMP2298]|nr:hypothetical protein B484DRAFT_399750 [Ochromonadaceae sp. CCMP2298]